MLYPLYQTTLDCLMRADPGQKVITTRELYEHWQAGMIEQDVETTVVRIDIPGRPERPELVSPRAVPKRGFDSPIGRVRMAHAIAHIEFNAINLALDAVYRFRGMPDEYYADWLQVASEEALHFTLLSDYLKSQNSGYGAYPSHNGLWEMALKTDHDVLIRMALVPRVLEARGLDVTQSMIARLQQAGDDDLAAIMQIIYRDEIGHVRIGSHWFKYLCERRGLDSDETFRGLLTEHHQATLTGPMDEIARTQAGFTRTELDFLAGRD
jgi:uncharacterized ferritin-like protein (DUF455 family)